MVADRKITPILEEALSSRFQYPKAAYRTVLCAPAEELNLLPPLPAQPVIANVIRTPLPGIVLAHERVAMKPAPGEGWADLLSRHHLCHVAVIERHGRSAGNIGHGFLMDFGLRDGAVASSVGHDSHNLLVAGTNEADMRTAVAALQVAQGGVCVVRAGQTLAMVELPIAGLLSDRRATAVAAETAALKRAWAEVGCVLPFMGFNLIPLSVIPPIRLTDKGLVLVPRMTLVPLFELDSDPA